MSTTELDTRTATADQPATQSIHVAVAMWRTARGDVLVPAPPHPFTLRSTSPAMRALWQNWLRRAEAARRTNVVESVTDDLVA